MPNSIFICKDRHGTRERGRHVESLTPGERLLACTSVTTSTKRCLRSIRASLDPIALQHSLETSLRRIFSTTRRTRPRA